LILLAIYFIYLLFQLKSHAYLFRPGLHHGSHMQSGIGSLIQRSQEHDHDRSLSPSSFSRTTRVANQDPRPPPDSNLKAKNMIELDMIGRQGLSESNAETSVQSDVGDLMDYADRPNRGRQSPIGQPSTAPGWNNTAYLPFSQAPYPSPSPQSLRRLSNQDEVQPRSTTGHGLVRYTSSILRLLNRSRGSLGYAPSDDFSDTPTISRRAALILLVSSSALVAFCAEFLVNTIDDMVANSPLSEPFIGLIILPIAGNVAELITSMTVATKNKMDLAIGVSVGSSIQIALFVTPLVVIVGWILGRDMTLHFTLFETVALVATAFLVNFVILDGKTNYIEGSLLCACYAIIGSVSTLCRSRTLY
jgi:Ca2+/H+ antiporter